MCLKNTLSYFGHKLLNQLQEPLGKFTALCSAIKGPSRTINLRISVMKKVS